MWNMPNAIKLILNLIFFSIYSVIAIFLAGFILWNVLGISYTDPNKVWYIAIAITFIITIIFRKFFYISFKK